VLNILFISILIFNIAYALLVIKLRHGHHQVYGELGSPAPIAVSVRTFSNVIEFVLKLRFLHLKKRDDFVYFFCVFIFLHSNVFADVSKCAREIAC
jgi:uncharacterized membrane protein YecN with MAPEG domain